MLASSSDASAPSLQPFRPELHVITLPSSGQVQTWFHLAQSRHLIGTRLDKLLAKRTLHTPMDIGRQPNLGTRKAPRLMVLERTPMI